jgi:hypothetical protein
MLTGVLYPPPRTGEPARWRSGEPGLVSERGERGEPGDFLSRSCGCFGELRRRVRASERENEREGRKSKREGETENKSERELSADEGGPLTLENLGRSPPRDSRCAIAILLCACDAWSGGSWAFL